LRSRVCREVQTGLEGNSQHVWNALNGIRQTQSGGSDGLERHARRKLLVAQEHHARQFERIFESTGRLLLVVHERALLGVVQVDRMKQQQKRVPLGKQRLVRRVDLDKRAEHAAKQLQGLAAIKMRVVKQELRARTRVDHIVPRAGTARVDRHKRVVVLWAVINAVDVQIRRVGD
jgi:hypothetical protein